MVHPKGFELLTSRFVVAEDLLDIGLDQLVVGGAIASFRNIFGKVTEGSRIAAVEKADDFESAHFGGRLGLVADNRAVYL
jgi:hypothetical protein